MRTKSLTPHSYMNNKTLLFLVLFTQVLELLPEKLVLPSSKCFSDY